MQDKANKTPSLSDIQTAIDKKVETFMGGPPEGKTPSKESVDAPVEVKDAPGAPPVSGMVIVPDNPQPQETAPNVLDDIPEDPKTEKAVDDIVAKESDEVLAAEDAEVAQAFEPKQAGFKQKIKDLISTWWNNKKLRWATIAGVVLILAGLFAVPITRYFMLNTVGVRSSSSLIVLDNSTQLPLKNVGVSIGSKSGTTDSDGKVKLNHLKLGTATLVIQKRAFAEEKRKITLGLGSNPLGNFTLKAVGSQYSFVTVDWLSGKPIEKAEASSGDASALSDKDGKILLTMDIKDEQKLPITIKAKGQRDEKFDLPVGTKDTQTIKMVSARKEVFVSKRSGKYDLYKIDVDGKNEELVLKGTGFERDDIALVPHPTDEVVAVVSTRDNVHNKDGYLLSTLTLIDLTNNSTTSLGQTERVQIVGWIDNRLIYVQVAASASAANPRRNRLMSYDYKTTDKKELAASNGFNDVLVAAGAVYYAPSSFYQSQPDTNMYKINADGTNKQIILDKETWNIFRVGYDEFNISIDQNWYNFKLGDASAHKLNAQPPNLPNRLFIDNVDKKHSLWVDKRDGKGVLLSYDIAAKTDKVLQTKSGLAYPLRWLNESTIIFRVQTPGETADYVMSTDSSEAHKIKDVTNTTGISQWYYY